MVTKAKQGVVAFVVFGLVIATFVSLNRPLKVVHASKVDVVSSSISPRLLGRWISDPDVSTPIAREITFHTDGTAKFVKEKATVIYRFTCESTNDYFHRLQKESGKTWDRQTKEAFTQFFPPNFTMVNLWSGQKGMSKSEGSLGFEPKVGLLYLPLTQVFHRADGTSNFLSSNDTANSSH